jgi:hypothetical protein
MMTDDGRRPAVQDWEDVNKSAFVQMIALSLIKGEHNAETCVRILYEAYRCRKAGIPMDLPSDVREFMEWQEEPMLKSKPGWVNYTIGAGIA